MGIRDRVINRLGYEISETPSFVPDTENRGIANTAPTRESRVVTEAAALSLVPVSRAIAVLETAIMQIPVQVKRGPTLVDSPAWLLTPDIENNVSQAEWIGTTLVHMATFGNAFWKVTRGLRGIVNIKNLHPSNVSVMTDTNGNTVYMVGGNSYTRNEIVHIKLWSKPDTTALLGEGPIQRHKSVLRSAIDLHNYADNWFKTSAVPTGTLTTTEFLSEDIAKSNKQAFIESQQERSVAVLSSGLKYDSISLDPKEAQFLENQTHIMRQIALMFGIPSIYVGLSIEGRGLMYVNGNEDRSKLYDDGLQQYIIRIQQAITDLLPRGQYAEFNLTEFLRPNQLARYQSYEIGIKNGFLTVPEIRELEGFTEPIAVVPDAIQDQGTVDDNQPIA
jgi:HK97 family phage portal protein